jgi:hypothetical protein
MPNDINFDGDNLEDPSGGASDDLLADLLNEELEAAKPEDKQSVNMDEYNALKAKVEDLEGANAGLLKAKQSEVSKRQTLSERQAQLEGAINAILSQRQQAGMESVTESQAAAAKAQGIPVTYDDDGNGWVDPSFKNELLDQFSQMLSPYEQKIQELEQRLYNTDAQSSAAAQAQRLMDGIIGEDERFGPASGRYRAARRWVEDQVSNYASENGIREIIPSGRALDEVFSDPFAQKQFEQSFPGISLFDVVTAEDSQVHFRNTLSNIAKTMTPEPQNAQGGGMDSRFQKVLDKPSTLGTNANAKAGQLSVLDRIGSMSTEEIMNLTDDQADTLLDLARKG